MVVQKPQIFRQVLLKIINEDVTSGVLATSTATQFSADTYAQGDTRIPGVLGQKRVKGKKRIPIQRRPKIGM